MKSKIIILLENENQIRNCMDFLNQVHEQYLIIALTPFVAYALDQENQPYKILEDYYTPTELFEQGVKNYQILEDLCCLIDNQIQQIYPRVKQLGIQPAFFNFYNLKICYDTVTLRLFQLIKLIETENPKRLVSSILKSIPSARPPSF